MLHTHFFLMYHAGISKEWIISSGIAQFAQALFSAEVYVVSGYEQLIGSC